MFGFININKPGSMTSHDVVNRIRRLTKIKQIGHCGTLDPMASGVLPIAIGKACRLISYLPNDKVYLAEILLGTVTDTDDIEGSVLAQNEYFVASDNITEAINTFVGTIIQKPPMYSAIHVNGKRLYELARQGKTVENIPERTVTIKSIEILNISFPTISLRIHCSSGTYIRSIARDLGEKLKVGGCLKSLVREKSGPFSLSSSYTLDDCQKVIERNSNEMLMPAQAVLDLTEIELDKQEAIDIKNGRFVIRSNTENIVLDKVMTTCQNSFIAVCQTNSEENCLKLIPEVVINDGK